MRSDSLHFLSCDWGTSHFRLRLVQTDTLNVLAEVSTDEGAGKIGASRSASERDRRFGEILAAHARKLFARTGRSAANCVISGMASSSLGWIELPYAWTPLPVCAEYLTTHRLGIEVSGHGSLQVVLISGVRTDRDVMRGEETEILGLLKSLPEIVHAKSACLLLPGTHSKHVRLEQGVLVRFSTFMTGELYSHLRSMPTLSAAFSDEDAFSEEEFFAGVDRGWTDGFSASLFQVRTRVVLPPERRRGGASFLSGLLIGAELAHLDATGSALYLGGAPRLRSRYAEAASHRGVKFRSIPDNVITRSVVRAHALFLESPLLPSQ